MFRRCASIVTLMLLASAMGLPPAAATPLGIVFTNSGFSGAIPSGYTGDQDFPSCEFNRYSSGGDHFQHIYSATNDTCSPHTNGSPSAGDVTIFKSFSVNPGEYYKAWAQGKMINPSNSRATVKLIYFNTLPGGGLEGLGECYGRTDLTSFQIYATDQFTTGLNGHAAPELSGSGGCKASPAADTVHVHFRIRAQGSTASGQAVLRKLRLGRCFDGGSCSNVPSI